MSIDNLIFNRAIEELTEGHLALDRLGAPREIDDEITVRELTLAERIAALTSALREGN